MRIVERTPRRALLAAVVLIVLILITGRADAQPAVNDSSAAHASSTPGASAAGGQTSTAANTIVCESKDGQREHCRAVTAAGVALVRSTGTGVCLLGKSWGYDDTGVWVSGNCGGEFLLGQALRVWPRC